MPYRAFILLRDGLLKRFCRLQRKNRPNSTVLCVNTDRIPPFMIPKTGLTNLADMPMSKRILADFARAKSN